MSATQSGATVEHQQAQTVPVAQPTDMYIQPYLKKLIPELDGLSKLQEAEKRIDIYLSRKKIDLHQNITQWTHSKYTDPANNQFVRVFISNISENQPWQTNDETMELDQASWTLRIEGRLLDDGKADDPNRPKFSSFIESVAVDFKPVEEDQDDETDQEMGDPSAEGTQEPSAKKPRNEQTVFEWHADPNTPVEFDGVDVSRKGTENINCTITIQPKGYTGEFLQYSPELSCIVGFSKGTFHEAIYSLYKYILLNSLLTNNDEAGPKDSTNGEKVLVKMDSSLAKLVSPERLAAGIVSLKLADLPSLVKDHVKPIPPIRLDYTVRVDQSSTFGDLVFDMEVPKPTSVKGDQKLSKDELLLLNEYNTLSTAIEPQIQELNQKTQLLQLQLNSSAKKYQFFDKLAKDPVPMLQDYMESSSQALKVLSGDAGFNEDTVRRSQFYQDNDSILFENIGVLLSSGRMK
ncbi:Snf12/Rsc6 [Kluyveromyces lactis]|nr:Snf12/Rsc6 [Kluyveromyces lactis]